MWEQTNHGQISGLTNRNLYEVMHEGKTAIKAKPNNYTESCMINEADGWRGRNVWYLGRSVRYALKEVTIA